MKAIGPRAKKVMDILTAKCGYIGDHDKFHTDPFMDVVVENIGDCNLGDMFSVAHYYKQNGDLMRDPEMCIIKGKDGEYYPYYYRLDRLGIEEDVLSWHDGSIVGYDTVRQKGQANFCESWMRNIKQQQERVKSDEITLILDRKRDDLWVNMEGLHKVCIWDVTGLERDEESSMVHVRILRNGKIIGGAWNVEEIKEKW